MGISKNKGTPKWMVYMENPIKMDDLGVPSFSETPKYFLDTCATSPLLLWGTRSAPFSCSSIIWKWGNVARRPKYTKRYSIPKNGSNCHFLTPIFPGACQLRPWSVSFEITLIEPGIGGSAEQQWQVFDSQCQAASASFLLAATASGVFSCNFSPPRWLPSYIGAWSQPRFPHQNPGSCRNDRKETSFKHFAQLMAIIGWHIESTLKKCTCYHVQVPGIPWETPKSCQFLRVGKETQIDQSSASPPITTCRGGRGFKAFTEL